MGEKGTKAQQFSASLTDHETCSETRSIQDVWAHADGEYPL